MKFKIGDLVVGNKKANEYGITTENCIGVVTGDANGENLFLFTALIGDMVEHHNCAGTEFAVNEDRFDLVKSDWIEPGMKLCIKKFDERPEHWNYDGFMDKYMGRVVTVANADEDGSFWSTDHWWFKLSDIDFERMPKETLRQLKKPDGEPQPNSKPEPVVRSGKCTTVVITEEEGVVTAKLGDCTASVPAKENADVIVLRELANLIETSRKCFTGKVVCIDSMAKWWEVGKIYEVNDGRITASDGDTYTGLKSVEFMNETLCGEFLQIVE